MLLSPFVVLPLTPFLFPPFVLAISFSLPLSLPVSCDMSISQCRASLISNTYLVAPRFSNRVYYVHDPTDRGLCRLYNVESWLIIHGERSLDRLTVPLDYLHFNHIRAILVFFSLLIRGIARYKLPCVDTSRATTRAIIFYLRALSLVRSFPFSSIYPASNLFCNPTLLSSQNPLTQRELAVII